MPDDMDRWRSNQRRYRLDDDRDTDPEPRGGHYDRERDQNMRGDWFGRSERQLWDRDYERNDAGRFYGRPDYRGQDHRGQDYRGQDHRGQDYRGQDERRDFGRDYGRRDYGRPLEPMSDRPDFGRFGGAGLRDYGRQGRGGDYGAGFGGGGFWRDRESGAGQGYGEDYAAGLGYGAGFGSRGYSEPGERRAGYGRDYNARQGNERGWWDRASDQVSSWFGDDDAERRRRDDQQRDEQHRGRGPRGYTRSDERIREDVNDRLTDHPIVNAADIEVTVSRCEVTLGGTVDSRYDKRLAEDIAERVSGVTHVQNNLRVRQHGHAGTSDSTTGASTAGTTYTGAMTGNGSSRNQSGTGQMGTGQAGGSQSGGVGTTPRS